MCLICFPNKIHIVSQEDDFVTYYLFIPYNVITHSYILYYITLQ